MTRGGGLVVAQINSLSSEESILSWNDPTPYPKISLLMKQKRGGGKIDLIL